MSVDKEFGDLFKSTQKSGGGSGDGGGEGDGGEGDADPQTADQRTRQAELQKTLDEGGKLPGKERLELARLRGTAPTAEQLGQGA